MSEQDAVTKHLAFRVRAWLAESRDRTQRQLAKAAGISPTHLSKMLTGDSIAGRKALDGLSQAIGTSWAEIEREARSGPRTKRSGLDEKQPNRSIAEGAARMVGISESAISAVRTRYGAEPDRPAREWVRLIMLADEALRFGGRQE